MFRTLNSEGVVASQVFGFKFAESGSDPLPRWYKLRTLSWQLHLGSFDQ